MPRQLLNIALVFGALTASSFDSLADDKYPAANFSPKVIYQDESVTKKDTARPEPDAAYPAANFTPKVIYQDESVVEKTAATSAQKKKKSPAQEQKREPKSDKPVSNSESESDFLYFLPLLFIILIFALLRKRQTVIDLTANVRRCQAATFNGTRCTRTTHLETAIVISHNQAYRLLLCKQHKSHFYKPFVKLEP